MGLDLIDEFRLDLHPCAGGEDTRLFDDVPTSYRLALVASTAFSNGIVGLQHAGIAISLSQSNASQVGGSGCRLAGGLFRASATDRQ